MIDVNTQKNEEESRQKIRQLAELMDSQFQLPFGWRIGWDGIIGLIPGLGDLITNGFSFYILFKAAQIGCPPSVLIRMCMNILIDNLVDMIPFLGFIFDFMWKSNMKNVQLMEDYLNQPGRTVTNARLTITVTIVLIIGFFVGLAWLTWWTALWVWGLLQSTFVG